MTTTASTPDATAEPTLAAEVRAMRLELHRLTTVVSSRLAAPVDLLTTAEAATRARTCTKTILKKIAMGVLTDRRVGTGRGAHRIMADELDVMIADGEDAVRRYRSRMGRD